MNHPAKKVGGKFGLALACAAAAASAVWFGWQQESIRALQAEVVAPVLSGSVYVAAGWLPPKPVGAGWSEPAPQSRGPGWLYEVFTPPVIYHDAATGSFTITTPSQVAELGGGAVGLELLAVGLKPYRLQLQGYFGEPGDYLAAFVSPLAPGTLLARPGHRFEALGLTLKSFAVRKIVVGVGDAGPVCEVAAFAVLQDETTGAEVVLDSRTRRLTDMPFAAFKTPGAPGKAHELLESDTFTTGGTSYRIARIQLDPPEVVVARTTPDRAGPEMLVLRPAVQVAEPVVPSKPLVPKIATDVARHAQEIPSP